jgi:predicted GIY-YIG superfamily endonuclease
MDAITAVYILANARRTVLYVGVTANLQRRIAEHRLGVHPAAFAHRYNVNRLVYLEATPNIAAAIAKEKQIKGWARAKKVALIEAANPEWRDLAEQT